ncbi:MAG: response regulator [Lachnospiraceae bacterium]|nr:response regulator [Lachnospiraceae bacterium]
MDNTMLIVDDNLMNREILKLLFQNKYEILEAENGREALEILESCQGHIDIVLLDIMMPDMDGLEVMRRKASLPYFKDVPVVIISSSEALDDQVKAFDLGANDFVNKPFVPEIVCSRVNNVMASHQRMLSIALEAERLKVKTELDQMTGLYNKTTAEYAINELLECQSDKLHALMVG